MSSDNKHPICQPPSHQGLSGQLFTQHPHSLCTLPDLSMTDALPASMPTFAASPRLSARSSEESFCTSHLGGQFHPSMDPLGFLEGRGPCMQLHQAAAAHTAAEKTGELAVLVYIFCF